MRISILLFVGVIFRESFGCNSIVGVARINSFRVIPSGWSCWCSGSIVRWMYWPKYFICSTVIQFQFSAAFDAINYFVIVDGGWRRRCRMGIAKRQLVSQLRVYYSTLLHWEDNSTRLKSRFLVWNVASASKTLLKAFTCSDDAYFVALRDMGVEHDGDGVLETYTRITSYGQQNEKSRSCRKEGGGDEGCSSEATQC